MIMRAHGWLAGLLLLVPGAGAAPVRVSFLDDETAREETLHAFAEAGCVPDNLHALRKAILHYYQTPLALDPAAFPSPRNGFYEFASIGDFVSTLGTNQLSFIDHAFELNCFNTALLLVEPEMRVTADLQARNGPFLAVQVTTNYNEWLEPVASLGDVYAIAHPPRVEPFMKKIAGIGYSEKHKTLEAALYQYQTLPLGTSADTISVETHEALRRHWKRCGIQFPAKISLVMLHRASKNYHLVVTDHMGVLLQRKDGYLYFEKTGGRGPFLRIDAQDPADIVAYFSTGTWPDYPFNFMTVNDGLFLDVPLRPASKPSVDNPVP
jgi:hypothetical protein